jgi:hypothetical protein
VCFDFSIAFYYCRFCIVDIKQKSKLYCLYMLSRCLVFLSNSSACGKDLLKTLILLTIPGMSTETEKPQTNGIDTQFDDELNHSRPADIEAVSSTHFLIVSATMKIF